MCVVRVCVRVYKFGTWSFIASMVTRKIWLKQCHRNNLLPYFFPHSIYCLVSESSGWCWMIRFNFVCAWIVCTRIWQMRAHSGIQRLRRFLFMYVQFTNLQFPCVMLYFAQIQSYRIRFDLIVWHIVWTSMRHSLSVPVLRSSLHSSNIQQISFLGVFPIWVFSLSCLRIRFACISFICSWLCRIRAHFVLMVDYAYWLGSAYVIHKHTYKNTFCEQQECEKAKNAFWYSLAACSIPCDIACLSNSHIVNKFGFIHFEILFSISHIFKNQRFFLSYFHWWDSEVLMVFFS